MQETPLLFSPRSPRLWLRASVVVGGSLPSAPQALLGLQALPALPAKPGATVPSLVEGDRPRDALGVSLALLMPTPQRWRFPGQEEWGPGQCSHLPVWFGFLEREGERGEEGKREEEGEGVCSGVRALLSLLAPALGFCSGSKH